MPNPRKPTNLLAMSGAIAKNPGRYADRQHELKPIGQLGTPPKHLTALQKKYWRELVAPVPLGVLTAADRIVVEVTTLLLEKLRNGTAKPVEIGHLRACLGTLGMTPSDRSRVSAQNDRGDEQADPLSLLLGRA